MSHKNNPGYKTARKDSHCSATEPRRDWHRQAVACGRCGRSHKSDDVLVIENAENVTKSDISNKCAGQET